MERMRRIGILALALGYGLSFVAVCLAACLMGPAMADHGCCVGDDGIRAADGDCCSVTLGVTHGSAIATASAVTSVQAPLFMAHVKTSVVVVQPVTAAPSPPLVLRV